MWLPAHKLSTIFTCRENIENTYTYTYARIHYYYTCSLRYKRAVSQYVSPRIVHIYKPIFTIGCAVWQLLMVSAIHVYCLSISLAYTVKVSDVLYRGSQKSISSSRSKLIRTGSMRWKFRKDFTRRSARSTKGQRSGLGVAEIERFASNLSAELERMTTLPDQSSLLLYSIIFIDASRMTKITRGSCSQSLAVLITEDCWLLKCTVRSLDNRRLLHADRVTLSRVQNILARTTSSRSSTTPLCTCCIISAPSFYTLSLEIHTFIHAV